MEIIPAIDLRHGKCVRLYQGDYAQETVFSEDPVGMAQRWQAEGAKRLHLVDLDGAAAGEPRNTAAIQQIVGVVRIAVQVGGGIRRLEIVKQLLQIGVQRVILGTAAVQEPALVEEACRRFGPAIIVSVDARDGFVSTHGWLEESRITAAELVQRMTKLGVERFIYTDVARDGTLTGPNFEAIEALQATTHLPIIVAGGISAVSHIQRLSQIGVEGAIVGTALYTGDIDLAEALAAVG
jgi:phosphoribosylformimino-5-aminoimidazole carboxamide ribotide isomerase